MQLQMPLVGLPHVPARHYTAGFALAATLVFAAGCGTPAQTTTGAAGPTSTTAAAAPSVASGAPWPAASAAPSAVASPAATAGLRLTIVPDASEVRFRAREQLAGRPAESDAIGTTHQVDGSIVFGSDGSLVSDASEITVNVDSLATDQARRDNFIKSNTLQTDKFPEATFVPRQAQGLTWPLPTSGTEEFQLLGDMTLHGTTKPATWDMTATFTPSQVTGSGATVLTLPEYGMEKPSVAAVLSIQDNITLELDFTTNRNPGS